MFYIVNNLCMQCRYVVWSYLGQITHIFLKVCQIWKVLKINHFKFQILKKKKGVIDI